MFVDGDVQITCVVPTSAKDKCRQQQLCPKPCVANQLLKWSQETRGLEACFVDTERSVLKQCMNPSYDPCGRAGICVLNCHRCCTTNC
jgi:hypothetical protein